MSAIVLSRALRTQLEQQAARAAPREICGLLIGERTAGQYRISGLAPSANLAAHPDQGFEIDPKVWLRLRRALAAAGSWRRVIGLYHSHPDGSTAPSAFDLRAAWDPGDIWLIIAVPSAPSAPSVVPSVVPRAGPNTMAGYVVSDAAPRLVSVPVIAPR